MKRIVSLSTRQTIARISAAIISQIILSSKIANILALEFEIVRAILLAISIERLFVRLCSEEVLNGIYIRNSNRSDNLTNNLEKRDCYLRWNLRLFVRSFLRLVSQDFS